VRVNVRLIKSRHNSPVWADTVDRPLTDILSLESEVAITVADNCVQNSPVKKLNQLRRSRPRILKPTMRTCAGLAYTLRSGGFEPANVIPARQ